MKNRPINSDPRSFAEFAGYLRRLLMLAVSYPEHFGMRLVRSGQYPIIEIHACPADTRRLIGENGRCFRAITQLINRAGSVTGCEPYLERIRQVDGPELFIPFSPDPNWPADRIIDTFRNVLTRCIGSEVRVDRHDTEDSTLVTFWHHVTPGAWAEGLDSAVRVLAATVGMNNGRYVRTELRYEPAPSMAGIVGEARAG